MNSANCSRVFNPSRMALRTTPSLRESSFSEGSFWPRTNLLTKMYSYSCRSTNPGLFLVYTVQSLRIKYNSVC